MPYTILGDITPTSVAILIDVSDSCEVKIITCKLREGEAIATSVDDRELFIPTTVVINNLKPEREYVVTIFINEEPISNHSFTTTGFRKIAFISCDFDKVDTGNSLWNIVELEKPDLCVHMGDNIYGDQIFHKLLSENNPDDPNNLIEAYEKVYRRVWSRWQQKLQNSSHIFILDDHDITDGANVNSFTPDSRESDIERAALKVYNRFNPCNKVFQFGRICYYPDGVIQETESGIRWKLLNRNTMMLMCMRYYTAGNPFPLNFLEEVMNTVTASGVENLIIVFTTAPVPLAQGKYRQVYEYTFGMDGLWTDEQAASLYSVIFDWLGGSMRRKVLVLGGDIHIGIQADIYKDDLHIPVFVSSPISNQPTPAEYLYAKGLNQVHQVGNYQVRIRARARRNFVMTEISENTLGARHVWSTELTPKSTAKSLVSLVRMKTG